MTEPDPAGPFRHPIAPRTSKILRAALLTLLLGLSTTVSSQAESLYRYGFSKVLLSEVNENDARAAIRTWVNMIANERGLPLEVLPVVFDDSQSLQHAIVEHELDGAAVTLYEYHQVRHEVDFDPFLTAAIADHVGEQYVLLAHRDSPSNSLSNLRGRHLLIHSASRNCLAPLWLDVHLHQHTHKTASDLFGKITEDTKLANVILPVFFRQAEACLVTRSGFMTMSELNPQVAQQLVVLAESELLIPVVYAFRADYNATVTKNIMTEMLNLNKHPAGQQLMNIFGADGLAVVPKSDLSPALRLIDAYNALRE
jgi:phosphonate transport system substrate-binding protein